MANPDADPTMKPGDEAPEGTPGTGDDVCRDCHGKGAQEGKPCPTCAGTGTITRAIGGG